MLTRLANESADDLARATNFGSVARGEDHEGSDVDLLVDEADGTTYFDLVDVQDEAESLTGIRFDVCTPGCLSAHFRAAVLKEARPL